jgi:hypothetical protein
MSESFLILFNSQGSNVQSNSDRSNITYFCNWGAYLPKKYKKFRCQFVFKSINYNALLMDNCLLGMNIGRSNVFDGVSTTNNLGCVYPVVLSQNSLVTTAVSYGAVNNNTNVSLQFVTGATCNAATTTSFTVTIGVANANIVVGMFITNPAIPLGTSVTAVTGTTITMSTACSIANNAVLLFYNPTTLITVGQNIVGNGIPSNTVVTAINASNSAITLSSNATIPNLTALMFYTNAVSFYSSTNNDNNDFFINYPANQQVNITLRTFAGNIPTYVPHYTLFLSLIAVDEENII